MVYIVSHRHTDGMAKEMWTKNFAWALKKGLFIAFYARILIHSHPDTWIPEFQLVTNAKCYSAAAICAPSHRPTLSLSLSQLLGNENWWNTKIMIVLQRAIKLLSLWKTLQFRIVSMCWNWLVFFGRNNGMKRKAEIVCLFVCLLLSAPQLQVNISWNQSTATAHPHALENRKHRELGRKGK